WSSIRIALPSSATFAAPIGESLVAAAELAPLRGAPWLETGALLGYAVATASLLGLALFAGDCLALRRCIRRWRAASRPGDELRRGLPPELASLSAEIRVVADSDVAAATGWIRPTIWIGDRHAGTRLKLALVHELTHARQHDPLWLVAIAAVRRLYWWNPLVAYLARQSVLMIESTCDHASAAHFAKDQYAAELASMLLAGVAPTPRLVATARTSNLDVLRLRLLGTDLRLRMRDVALLAAVGAIGAATATASVVEPERPLATEATFALPDTPAAAVLATLIRATNTGDSDVLTELLGAYTPQELPLPLPRDAGHVRVVEVLHSDPSRIEYVVESRGGTRHVGEITVSAAVEITESRLERLP
ncbi:MAG TPA: M56 family metallopeptidase, partial [Gammaproteobacteria bacterium]|nr:M56 family metallopeptidase [Gammaproteobacteria bacterium]